MLDTQVSYVAESCFACAFGARSFWQMHARAPLPRQGSTKLLGHEAHHVGTLPTCLPERKQDLQTYYYFGSMHNWSIPDAKVLKCGSSAKAKQPAPLVCFCLTMAGKQLPAPTQPRFTENRARLPSREGLLPTEAGLTIAFCNRDWTSKLLANPSTHTKHTNSRLSTREGLNLLPVRTSETRHATRHHAVSCTTHERVLA